MKKTRVDELHDLLIKLHQAYYSGLPFFIKPNEMLLLFRYIEFLEMEIILKGVKK